MAHFRRPNMNYTYRNRTRSALFAFFLWLVGVRASRAGVSSVSTNLVKNAYENQRALDSYGNAVQLKHAKEAANSQGRLFIIVKRLDDTWVVTRASLPNHLEEEKGSPSSSSFVHLLHPLRDGKYQAVVCTGVKADASWLVRKLREYHRDVWDRYGGYGGDTVSIIACLKRSFWGYKDTSWLGSLQRKDSWARPMGIVSVLITDQANKLYSVEPSGAIETHDRFHCIGKGAEISNSEVASRLNSIDIENDEELRETLVEIITKASGSRPDGLSIDIVSRQGIESTIIKLK